MSKRSLAQFTQFTQQKLPPLSRHPLLDTFYFKTNQNHIHNRTHRLDLQKQLSIPKVTKRRLTVQPPKRSDSSKLAVSSKVQKLMLTFLNPSLKKHIQIQNQKGSQLGKILKKQENFMDNYFNQIRVVRKKLKKKRHLQELEQVILQGWSIRGILGKDYIILRGSNGVRVISDKYTFTKKTLKKILANYKRWNTFDIVYYFQLRNLFYQIQAQTFLYITEIYPLPNSQKKQIYSQLILNLIKYHLHKSYFYYTSKYNPYYIYSIPYMIHKIFKQRRLNDISRTTASHSQSTIIQNINSNKQNVQKPKVSCLHEKIMVLNEQLQRQNIILKKRLKNVLACREEENGRLNKSMGILKKELKIWKVKEQERIFKKGIEDNKKFKKKNKKKGVLDR